MDFVNSFRLAESRDSLFVPSMKCQTLLGKAIQEHFTKPEQVASVFSSSPSLRNSSVGANFLTNFRLDWQTSKIFETVFTPEDCFSIQFTFEMRVFDFDDEIKWNSIISFIQNFITKTRFFEASLRTLSFVSKLLNDEQIHFILSHLRRITKLELILDEDCAISSVGLSSIENLIGLEELHIYSSRAVTTDVIQLFASKLNNLKVLSLNYCDEVKDDGMYSISHMSSLLSLSLLSCMNISSAAFNHLAKMVNLVELTVNESEKFNDENLEKICQLVSLRRLDVSACDVTNEGMKFLKSLENLEFLSLRQTKFTDEGIDAICGLKKLSEIDLSNNRFLTDAGVEKISRTLLALQKVHFFWCSSLKDETLEHLKRLPYLKEVNVQGFEIFSVRSTFSFLKATEPRLTRFAGSGKSSCVWDIFANSSSRVLNWNVRRIDDEDVALLIEIVGDDRCREIEEVSLSFSQITEISVALILKKMRNLSKLRLERCDGVNFEKLNIQLENCGNLDQDSSLV
jgi:hypothetical protein